MALYSTHTYAVLPVSKACYEEIMHALMEVGYDHCFDTTSNGILIDMHGIALGRKDLTDE